MPDCSIAMVMASFAPVRRALMPLLVISQNIPMIVLAPLLAVWFGFGIEPTGRANDGVFISCFNVAAFRDLETFKREVTEFAEYLAATPPRPGFERVYYPGEPEHLKTLQKRKDGIYIEDATWEKLTKLAVEFGLADDLGMG